MQLVFQDPYASLNPREKVRDLLSHALALHGIGTRADRADRLVALLEQVGLSADHLDRFPHEFSGGQRQRIVIARALAVEPEFLVADEPVSALDVSIQAQVINLLEDLKARFGLTMLFIAHDLAVVEHICDRVIVMYLGKVMEIADADALYARPAHPYTQALLSAVPVPDPSRKRLRVALKGDMPSPVNPPSGCVFRTRCPRAEDICAVTAPPLREIAPGHVSACHFAP
jgi:oligopeptide/dipeptide ABC transporter ATP-binding protein